ncbi:glycosyltransferase family 2 protein [Parasynechococcus marenigrum]|uniref:Possible glycosyltransferase n=1 Tax=Parasynechococcus marenigrum (strain WH8102) TaxID=84588 RepID=Q7U905_PARMW|nr:glycosyltransferase [Parasynechococcus marenigrum]CAE06969.1 Possible glycosyltransferase [Parasynechococcus marenigrum WH 8102]
MIDITVCIVTFNRSHLLDDCINSVLSNKVPSDFIHVIDNSTSSVHLYVNSLIANSYNVLYFQSPVPGNLSTARNLSISNTASTFWTFVDDDDRWPSNYLESIDKIKDMNSASVILTYGQPYHNSSYPFDLVDTLHSAFLLGLTPPVGMQVYNLKKLLPSLRYSEQIKSGVDHDLWISLLEATPSVYVNRLPFNIISVPSQSRITQSYSSRKRNISKSLKLWRGTLNDQFGIHFFNHFCRCYQTSLDDLLYSKILKGHWQLLLYFNLFYFLMFIVRRLSLRLVSNFLMFVPYNSK